MTFTYTGDPVNVLVDRVRYELSDTLEECHLLEDEDIECALALDDDDILRACARLCNILATRYARDAEIRVSTQAIDRTPVSRNFLGMAKMFLARAVSIGNFRMPALSLATKDTHEADTDIPQPAFARGMMDNPETSAPPEDVILDD